MNLFQQAFGNTPATDLRSLINDGAFLVDVRKFETIPCFLFAFISCNIAKRFGLSL